jgi:amidase
MTTPDATPVRLAASAQAFAYDGALPAALTVTPGTTVVFETADARDGALAGHPAGSGFVLPPPPPGRGNPLTGPLAISGAEPGDTLVVDVLAIDCGSPGWAGAHAHVNPLEPGRIPVSLARSCTIDATAVRYADGIDLALRPMVGCIGTAPAVGAPGAGAPGRHGGNLDHPIIAAGSRVYLGVSVEGGFLFVGDVHAAQGDGELSGVAVEVPAEVTLRVDVVPGSAPAWPWVVTRDRISVLTSAAEFAVARREAVSAMLDLIERRLELPPAEALGLISASGDLRLGQAFGGMDLTLRLELPRLPGLDLLPGEATRGGEGR